MTKNAVCISTESDSICFTVPEGLSPDEYASQLRTVARGAFRVTATKIDTRPFRGFTEVDDEIDEVEELADPLIDDGDDSSSRSRGFDDLLEDNDDSYPIIRGRGVDDLLDEDAWGDDEDMHYPSRNHRKKLLLMVVLPFLLVTGALSGAYFAGLIDPFLK